MTEPSFDHDDTKLLFEALFDIKQLIASILAFLEGGDDDGEEETDQVDG